MVEDFFEIVGSVQAGTFRVDAAVAEGGFAVIYRAHHTGFRANVALKCLKIPGSMSPEDQNAFLTSFREEAELLFHLSAALPTVVRPLQVGKVDSKLHPFVPFIALEWLEGTTLDNLIRERAERGEPPMPIDEAVKLLTPVAEALDKAHQFPAPGRDKKVCIVHRDLKPENIFVAKLHGEQIPKILDFGIAKVKSAATQVIGRQSAKQDALVAFTPAYGSPEQWLPRRFGQTGPWTDVYGLAITMVELLCGHSPIDGDQMAMMAMALDVENRPTPRAEKVPVSEAVDAVFKKALAVDPQDRYHSIADFWNGLKAAVAGQAVAGQAVAGQAVAGQATADQASAVPELGIPPAPESPKPTTPKSMVERPVGGRPATEVRAPAPRATSVARNSSRGNRIPTSQNYLLGKTIDGFDDDDDDGPPLRSAELEGVGLMPRSGVSASAVRVRDRVDIRPRKAKRDLTQPFLWLAAAIGLMMVDWAYNRFMGESLRVGPVRTLWVAGPLALAGFAMLLVRVFAGEE